MGPPVAIFYFWHQRKSEQKDSRKLNMGQIFELGLFPLLQRLKGKIKIALCPIYIVLQLPLL